MVHKHWSTYIVHCKWSVLVDTIKYITILIWITLLFSVSFACTSIFIDLQTGYTRCLLCTHRNCGSSWSSCNLCVPLHRTLYHTLLNGRANFIYFYWRLWRGPGDSLSLHTVEVSGNVDPYERPDNFFDKEVVSTLRSVSPSSGFVVIFENVLWICALPLAVSSCALLSVVSLLGCSVAQVDVETMVVEVIPVDLQLLSALVPVPVCFFCLTLWDCFSQIFHTCDKLAWHVYP